MEPRFLLRRDQREPNMSMLRWNTGEMQFWRGSFQALVSTRHVDWSPGGKLTFIGPGGDTRMPRNSYKAARIVSDEYNLYYAVWCTNEHELYDLSVCSQSVRV